MVENPCNQQAHAETLNKLAKEYGVKVQLECGEVPGEKVAGSGYESSRMTEVSQEEALAAFRRGDNVRQGNPGETGTNYAGVTEYGILHPGKNTKFFLASEERPGTKIHTLEVPEQMKKQIKAKGFPLYSKTLQDTMAGLQRMA